MFQKIVCSVALTEVKQTNKQATPQILKNSNIADMV